MFIFFLVNIKIYGKLNCYLEMFYIFLVFWEYYDSLLFFGFEIYINFNEIFLRDFLF